MDCFCEWLHANGWRLGQKEWDCWAEDGEGGRSCSWWSLSAWYQRMDGEAGNPDALLDAPAPKITPCVRMLDLCLTLSLRMSFHCKLPCTLEEWDLLWWCSEVLLIHSLFNPLDHLLRLGLVELLEEALFTHLSCNSCEYLSVCLSICLSAKQWNITLREGAWGLICRFEAAALPVTLPGLCNRPHGYQQELGGVELSVFTGGGGRIFISWKKKKKKNGRDHGKQTGQ